MVNMSLENIFTFENLYNAHKSCRKSKQHKGEVIRFEIDLSRNITNIIKDLLSGKYKVGQYRTFKIFEPKERIIEALPYKDRVILNCFCNVVLIPKISKHLIYDNVACQKQKGPNFGIERLIKFLKREYINNGNNNFYYLKCDIKKYFPSINYEVLINKLKKIELSEEELKLSQLFMFANDNGCGLPLGNLSSQWFALLYLNDLDRLIKEKLKIKGYVRYMDDFILIHSSKNYLKHCLSEIDKFCKNDLKLSLNNKTQIGKVYNGIDFLGYRITLTSSGKITKKLRTSSRNRMKKHLKTLKKLEDKNIVDKNYVNIRKSSFYSRIKETEEKKAFINQVKP